MGFIKFILRSLNRYYLIIFYIFHLQGICLVEGESQFNSSAIGSMNWDGSKDYGLFQISEKYWCLPGVKRTTGCKLRCEGRLVLPRDL